MMYFKIKKSHVITIAKKHWLSYKKFNCPNQHGKKNESYFFRGYFMKFV